MGCLEVVVVLLCAGLVGGIHRYPKLGIDVSDGGDPGQPLFLTPYIEHGDVAEGRRLARVPITDTLNIESYAGYFSVNKTYDSNQFFWYFPAMNATPDAPVVLWLQGGPGGSSLYGLLQENGPIRVHKGQLQRREIHWALGHHLIYIDNPVGTGFSFTNNTNGYCENEVQVGEQLFSSLTQFFELFPALQVNKFFITGESYAGKYIPALAYTIHNNNPSAKVKINLKGLAIGNGWCDPELQMVHGKYLNQIGLIDGNQLKIFDRYEKETVEYIKQRKWNEAYDKFDNMINGALNQKSSVFYNMTGFEFYYNYLHTKDYTNIEEFSALLQKSSVRKSIHVGDMPFNDGVIVQQKLKADVMKSVAPWISELLDHYTVLIYNGQLDIIVAYPTTVNFLRNLNFTGAEQYKTAERHLWKVDGEVAGYYKRAGRLVEVLVRNAGHMVPTDQPRWAFDLISRLTGAGDQINFNDDM